tara:strand:+ start:656 stop:1228 length:573 start_codon:yes stop_codon:yes gene_type:complete
MTKNKTKKFRLTALNAKRTYLKESPFIAIFLALFIDSVVRKPDFGFITISFSFLALFILLVTRNLLQSRKVFITTSEEGVTLENGRFYPWDEVTAVKPLEVKLQIYAAPTPGLTLQFKDGKECVVTQRLADYTGFYQQLYRHNVPGSKRSLYLYDVDLLTGSKKVMTRQYHSIYYPDKQITVKQTGIATY